MKVTQEEINSIKTQVTNWLLKKDYPTILLTENLLVAYQQETIRITNKNISIAVTKNSSNQGDIFKTLLNSLISQVQEHCTVRIDDLEKTIIVIETFIEFQFVLNYLKKDLKKALELFVQGRPKIDSILHLTSTDIKLIRD